MTGVRAPAVEPLPPGFGITFDASAQELEPGLFAGGRPWSVLRVTEAGRPALEELRTGVVRTRSAGLLARRLVDAGLLHPLPSGGSTDAITVVIPVYARVEPLRRCLAALSAPGALGDRHQTIVVDDGSPDPDAIRAVVAPTAARLIRLPRNEGPAAARNAGLRAADTPLVAFVDSDTLPAGDALAAVAHHLLDPSVHAVAPRITARSDDTWAGRYTRVRCPLDLGVGPAPVRPYGAVAYLPSAVLVARRESLLAIGGFAEGLRVGEDVDLVWRLLGSGRRVRYAPEVRVGHQEPTGTRALIGRRFRYGTSTAVLGRRHPDNVAPFIAQPAFVATVVAALTSRPRLTVAAAAASYAQVRRSVVRAGLPPRRLLPATASGLWHTHLGLGRMATQFAAPLLLAGLAGGSARHRAAAAALVAAPIVTTWRATDRSLDLPRFTVAAVIDDVCYGAGVYAGCLTHRTLRPLRPRILRRPIRKQTA